VATHAYPIEPEERLELRDGPRLQLRPMRPDDTERERAFVAALSERSRFQRFMQHLEGLTPAMLARFTHPDYDRELALVALEGERFVAVGRYAPNADGVTAKAAGYSALVGHILHENRDMLDLAAHLGFAAQAGEGGDVTVVRRL